ncbi:MAG: signal recognition particle-docking protein FtsY [Solitalea-like symbiont of Acarus siro]
MTNNSPESSKTNDKLNSGLDKTRSSFFGKLSKTFLGRTIIDDSYLDNLENLLIESDVGINTTLKIIDRLQDKAKRDKYLNINELNDFLYKEIVDILNNVKCQPNKEIYYNNPYVIMVVGVNGVGKTTTIGKLANKFTSNNKSVLLGAGDTFRAAAIEQLQEWGKRSNAKVIAQKLGADPSSVAFDTLNSAKINNVDIAIIDTAGRLHNKEHLMSELAKIKRAMSKVINEAPHEVLLVLDASTGQNAFEQCRNFQKVTQVNALAVTKLDGTAKGGMLIGLVDEFKIPIKYIGAGESIDDLYTFNSTTFVKSLFNK